MYNMLLVLIIKLLLLLSVFIVAVMSACVVTRMQLSKPQHMLLQNYFSAPDIVLSGLSAQRQQLCTLLHDIEISGSVCSAISAARHYAECFSSFWSRPEARSIRSSEPLQFDWSPLLSENEDTTAVESSTCVWFELSMTHMLCGQLYYSMAVERLVQYEENRVDNELKYAASYFTNAAHFFLRASHTVQSLWTTNLLPIDPAIRRPAATQIWMKLSLAAAQHCYVIRLEATRPDSLSLLSKLCAGEAGLYKEVVQLMTSLRIQHVLKRTYQDIAELYIAAITKAYTAKLSTIETTKTTVCKKEMAWMKLIKDIEKLLPDISHEAADEQLRTLRIERESVFFISFKENESVPRDMLPTATLKVAATQPSD